MLIQKYSIRILAIALCLGLATSCAKREETDSTMTSDTTVAGVGSDHGGMTGDSSHNSPGNTDMSANNMNGGMSNMSDANIVGFMGMADSMEIAAAKMAQSKAKNAEVKKFASMMVNEHTKMKSEGTALAKKQNITPQPPAGDMMGADMTSTMDAMKSASGTSFDSLYINSQVAAHERVLQNLQSVNPQDTALKSMVDKARTHVQHHLDEAKRIQGSMMTK